MFTRSALILGEELSEMNFNPWHRPKSVEIHLLSPRLPRIGRAGNAGGVVFDACHFVLAFCQHQLGQCLDVKPLVTLTPNCVIQIETVNVNYRIQSILPKSKSHIRGRSL